MMVFSEIVGSKSVKINWQSNIQNTKYQVQYRKRTSPNPSQGGGYEWFSTYTLNTQTTITDLDVATDYEFRVGATCEPTADPSVPYTFSGINNFSTPAAGATTNAAFSCGLNPAVNITNTSLLPNLIESETFFANDFPVKVLEVTGSNGIYSGNGFIIVPYLSETRIKVSFENISINTDYKLIEGQVLTTYNPSWNNVFDIDPVIVQIFGDQSETQNTEDPGVDDTAENDTSNSPDINTNTGTITGSSSTTGSGNTNPDTNNNNNNDPNSGNSTTTGNNTTNTTNNSTAGSSSGTNSTGNDYYIEYKGQKFFNPTCSN